MTLLSDFIFACLEDLESLKVSNTIPQKFASSSSMARPRIGTPSSGCSGSVSSCRWTMSSTLLVLEGLEGLKVDNNKPQKIVSSSRWSRYTKRCPPPAEGAR